MAVAAYIRVSSGGHEVDGQRRALKRWLLANGLNGVRWFVDKRSGNTLERPELERLQEAVLRGEVSTVVVCRIDGLCKSLTAGVRLLADWYAREVRVVSVTQGIDFAGASGTMLSRLVLGLAEVEQKVRRERQAAGIADAKARGGLYKGRKPGAASRSTQAKASAVMAMRASGKTLAEIARLLELDRGTVKRVLARNTP